MVNCGFRSLSRAFGRCQAAASQALRETENGPACLFNLLISNTVTAQHGLRHEAAVRILHGKDKHNFLIIKGEG